MKGTLTVTFLLALTGLSALTGFAHSNVFIGDTKDPVVQILYPLDQGFIQQGFPLEIVWNVTEQNLAENSTDIFLSVDGGDVYSPIVLGYGEGNSYVWTSPNETIENAMIKVVTHDSFGNVGACTSSESFIIGPLIPLPPQDMVLHAINPTDMQISWTPVNQGSFGQDIQVQGYKVYYSEMSPTDDSSFYLLENVTEGCSCVHIKALEHWDRLFYKVYAYVPDVPSPLCDPILMEPQEMTRQDKALRLQR